MAKQKTKNNSMDTHTIKRFQERFNLSLEENNIREIVNIIKRGGSKKAVKQTNTRTVHVLEYRGIEFAAVYNHQRKHLHTVFPVDWMDKEEYVNEI